MGEEFKHESSALKRPSSPRELIKMTTIAYGAMAFVGFEICWWQHQNIRTLLGPITYDAKQTAAIIFVSTLFLFLCQKLMELYLPSYRKFKSTLKTLFSGIGWKGAIWLALTSSIGEEILFRGAIQPFLGIWFTSLLFGLMHLDPEHGVSGWTFWAFLAGILLGGTVIVTSSLWPAIAIHFVINFVGIRSLGQTRKQSTVVNS